MPSLLLWIPVGLGVALLFTLAIFAHEWGHYRMARLCGLRVEGFSIGFGPKIFGWTDRHGVEWAIRWIPAGGFVKLPQMVTSEMIEGRSGTGLPPIRPIHKILVALAGPFMNVVLAFGLGSVLWVIGLPVALNHTIIGYVPPDSAEARLGIKEGDRIIAIEDEPMHNWDDIQNAAILALTNVVSIEIEHADGHRATYPVPTEYQPAYHLKLLRLGPKGHPVVKRVLPGSAAEGAGLKSGDEFVAFDGIQIVGQRQLIGLIGKRAGQRTRVEVMRDGVATQIEVTPRLDPTEKVGRIGVEVGYPEKLAYTVQRPGPTPWQQVVGSVSRIGKFVRALTHQTQSGVGVEHLHGPVLIFTNLATELRIDPRLAISLLVMLNINLALLNLLPLPVLDGGHILIALWEMLTGRSIGARVQEALSLTFALLLVAFMLFVTGNDVASLFRLRSPARTDSPVGVGDKVPAATNAPGR